MEGTRKLRQTQNTGRGQCSKHKTGYFQCCVNEHLSIITAATARCCTAQQRGKGTCNESQLSEGSNECRVEMGWWKRADSPPHLDGCFLYGPRFCKARALCARSSRALPAGAFTGASPSSPAPSRLASASSRSLRESRTSMTISWNSVCRGQRTREANETVTSEPSSRASFR